MTCGSVPLRPRVLGTRAKGHAREAPNRGIHDARQATSETVAEIPGARAATCITGANHACQPWSTVLSPSLTQPPPPFPPATHTFVQLHPGLLATAVCAVPPRVTPAWRTTTSLTLVMACYSTEARVDCMQPWPFALARRTCTHKHTYTHNTHDTAPWYSTTSARAGLGLTGTSPCGSRRAPCTGWGRTARTAESRHTASRCRPAGHGSRKPGAGSRGAVSTLRDKVVTRVRETADLLQPRHTWH